MKRNNPTIKELELSYTKPEYWYNRTLDIRSREWKELRSIILERDNRTCRFCKIRLSDLMIVDHINGDATDNSLGNLGLNCQACDAIRHCGFAGINDVLIVKKSELKQVDIVKKTHQFYLENNRNPQPEEIDPDCQDTEWEPIEVAESRFEDSDISRVKLMKLAKGFFNQKMWFGYLKSKIWEAKTPIKFSKLTSKSIDNEEKLYFLKELNENQREAVTCEDKRICVVAGPGCGKTKTLVSRVIYLLKSKIATPDQILLLTFSKKAIKEIKERIKDSLGSKPGSVINVSNIHSFCCKFLRRHIFLLGVKDNKFAIYDRKDQEEVVRQILEDMDLALYSDKKEVKAIVNSITQCKSKGMTNFVVLNDLWTEVALKYENYLRKNKALDFVDLLLKTLEILRNNQSIRVEYQNKFSHILVDEFQDINEEVQWSIIRLLNGKDRNIFIVGDPNQCIYGFQGSSPELITKLEKDEKWTNIRLNTNYRSNANIVELANNFMVNNQTLIQNILIPIREKSERVKIEIGKNIESIVREIIHLNKTKKVNLNEILVLYRSNYLSNWLEQELIRRKIPYEILGEFKFIEREEIKDVLSYLKAIIFQDDLSILRVLKLVERIGNSTIKDIKDGIGREHNSVYHLINRNFGFNKEESKFSKLRRQQKENIDIFINCLNWFKNNSFQSGCLLEFVEDIIESFNYYECLLTKNNSDERKDNIKQLLNMLKNWEEKEKRKNFESKREAGVEFLHYLTLAFENKELKKERDNLVLSTVHQAKGLEFKVVFFIYLDVGIIPSYRSRSINEEVRIFFVGITRAKEKLYLISNNGNESIFLKNAGV